MCVVSECDGEAMTVRRPWPTGDCQAMEKKLWNYRDIIN